MKENKITHRQLLKKEDAVAYLEDLMKCLKAGKIVIERNDQFVSMAAPDSMNMEISAKDKKDKNELCIELSWRKEPFVPDIASLNISSTEPPVHEEIESDDAAKADVKDAPKTDANTTKPEKDAANTPADTLKITAKTPPVKPK